MKKINPNGLYLPFPGITVVASIFQEDLNFWNQIYQLLSQSELIKTYFSPLPVDSYHVTTLNLCVASDFQAQEWPIYLHTALKHVYQPIWQYLHAHAFKPEIHFEHIHTQGAIQLVFTLPEHQQTIIVETAKQFGLETQIPPAYHMTLAYQYRDIPKAELACIEDYLHAEVYRVMQLVKHQCRLNVPTLSYFFDMTAFHPWDAQKYPF
ncbi:MAG: DUF1868 domain-containing protein [Gammaproteobacteria bacterium]|nr:DUF1868 domain-containing protein [Gammaproteobacteria bacterium]